jgi:hypothetical protein
VVVAAAREVVALVAPVAERLEVPVGLAEQLAQLAEQQRAPQCGYDDWQRRELERDRSTPRRQHNE